MLMVGMDRWIGSWSWLAWYEAAGRRVYIHQVNQVNSRSSCGPDDSPTTIDITVIITIL